MAIKRMNVARCAHGPERKAGSDQKHNVCLADTRPQRYKAGENRDLMPPNDKITGSGRFRLGPERLSQETLTKSPKTSAEPIRY